MRCGLISLLLLVFSFCPIVGQDFAETVSPSENKTPASNYGVGLVLSGGGAKGIAHIGMIQAIEEAGIPIDCIAGTSMGSIVGSLYAAGYSPAEMMLLIKSKSFSRWSSGESPEGEDFPFAAPELSPGWVGVNLPIGKLKQQSITDVLPTRLINPLPMSFAFMELYAPVTGACNGNFNHLMVPLRTVASDIYHHRSVVFNKGELSEAVRSSMSFPLVFQPIEVDSMLLFDGGLYDVYPVNVMMKDFNPKRVIGIDVSTPNTKPQLNNLIGQLENMIMDDKAYPFPTDKGINVRFDLSRFGLLAWDEADSIYAIGYKRGVELSDSLKALTSQRRSLTTLTDKRDTFKKKWKELKFSNITISGTTPEKTEYINYLLSRGYAGESSPTVTIEQARNGFYRVASTGRMRNFVPHAVYDSISDTYSLQYSADLNPDLTTSVGGYLTTSAGSMLYASVKYDPFRLYAPGASLKGWAGPNYLALEATGDMRLATKKPSSVTAELNLQQTRMHDTERLFYNFTTPVFLKQSQVFGQIEYEMELSRISRVKASAGFGHLSNKFHDNTPDREQAAGGSILKSNMGCLSASYTIRTLNDILLPTSGQYLNVEASLLSGRQFFEPASGIKEKHNRTYLDLNAAWIGYKSIIPHFSLGLSASGYFSTRSLCENYNAALIDAPQFSPTASIRFRFDPELRTYRYLSAGGHPVYSISSSLQVRGDAWLYLPIQRIMETPDGDACYSKAFDHAYFLGRVTLAFKMPVGALRVYAEYANTAASRWSAGLSLGLPIYASRLIQ